MASSIPQSFHEVVASLEIQAFIDLVNRLGSQPCPAPPWDSDRTYRVSPVGEGYPVIERLAGGTWEKAGLEPPPLTLAAARKLVGEFLVTRPLYSPLRLVASPVADRKFLLPPIIRRPCSDCREDTNWQAEERGGGWAAGFIAAAWKCLQCGGCKFAVWIDIEQVAEDDESVEPEPAEPLSKVAALAERVRKVKEAKEPPRAETYELTKVGQWEPWSIRPDAALEKELEATDRALYRKALMNMSQGYGLGALAYFRRVVENETGRLLDVVAELAKDEGDEGLLAELEKAKKGHNADERLRLAANATPASLKIGGVNPLKTIHSITSGGVHNGDEAACMGLATELRAAFEYVFRHVRDVTGQRAELRRVLTKRRAQSKPDV